MQATLAPSFHRTIATLALISGALMAAYLVLRPYGDAAGGNTIDAARAFASPLWIVTHLAGAAALVTLSALWAVAATGAIRWISLAAAALVLPYYGAETFALHEIGAGILAGGLAMTPLVAAVRDNPAAMTTFGAGLILLAVAGIAATVQWYRTNERGIRSALIPLAVIATLFLPQYFLPPAGRIAYGVLFAAVAAYTAYSMRRPSPQHTR